MAKIPLITIVGSPNTGKSTLFNRLVRQKKALVHNQPGMTRDIFKHKFKLNDRTFHIQDSGGFFPDQSFISAEIVKRIIRECKISDIVIFLFDGKRELLDFEKDFFLDIYKLNPNIIPVINKVDNPKNYLLPTSYYSLKKDFIFISAEHAQNIDEILEKILKMTSHLGPAALDAKDLKFPRISIVGKPNVGKSSLINKILQDDRVIVSPVPGTTRDSVDYEIHRHGQTFLLVDNAGIRNLKKVKEETESAAVIRAEKDIQHSDIIFFMLDLSAKIDQNDLFIASKILRSAKPVIIIANKWDLVMDKQSADAIVKRIQARLSEFYFAPVILISALSGKNVNNALNKAEEIYKTLYKNIETPKLNRIFKELSKERLLATEDSKRFNPKYISIESHRPLFICFHTSNKGKLTASDEKYLKKLMHRELALEGIPIFFKIIANP